MQTRSTGNLHRPVASGVSSPGRLHAIGMSSPGWSRASGMSKLGRPRASSESRPGRPRASRVSVPFRPASAARMSYSGPARAKADPGPGWCSAGIPWVIGSFLRGWQMDVSPGHPHDADPRAFLEEVNPRIHDKLEEAIKVLDGVKLSMSTFGRTTQVAVRSTQTRCCATSRRPSSRPV